MEFDLYIIFGHLASSFISFYKEKIPKNRSKKHLSALFLEATLRFLTNLVRIDF